MSDMERVEQQTVELDAAFNQGYEFEAGGRKFTVRRLTIHDIFALARICAVGLRTLGPKIANQQVTEENLMMVMSAAIPLAEDETVKWAASLVGMDKKQFEQLPPDVLLGIVETLRDHVDVKAFFARLVRLMPGQMQIVNKMR